jgi:hypothetical protein
MGTVQNSNRSIHPPMKNCKKFSPSEKIGHLVVVRILPVIPRKGTAYECLCECGKMIIALQGNLNKGKTSCGCHRSHRGKNRSVDFAVSRHPLYSRWQAMIHRCFSIKDSHFYLYGGRGIKVCERWQNPVNFYADMYYPFWDGASLDRINNDGDYEPSNCRWVTAKAQGANRRTNRFFEQNDGSLVSAIDVAEQAGISWSKAYNSLYRGRQASDLILSSKQ